MIAKTRLKNLVYFGTVENLLYFGTVENLLYFGTINIGFFVVTLFSVCIVTSLIYLYAKFVSK